MFVDYDLFLKVTLGFYKYFWCRLMKSHLFLLCILFIQIQLLSQPISGYVKNNAQQGLADKSVEVYMTIDGNYVIGSDLTASNGYFVTSSYTDIEDEHNQIEGIVYTAGSNSANIEINTISSSNVIIKLFDITGQEVYKFQGENTGKKIYPLPVSQFANALYISAVTVNGKTDVNKILSIDDKLYFGKTSSLVKKSSLNKNSLTSTLDSIIVSGDAIKRTTFTYNLSISGSYSVGNLVVDSNYVNLILDVKKLMEWKQTNNQLSNALVNISGQEKITDANGRANFYIPSGRNTLNITHPQIYDRETILRIEKDSTHTEYILDTLNFTSAMMDMYNDIFGRIWPGWGYQASQWAEPPIIYIVADTTQEPDRGRVLQQIAKIDTVLKPAYTTPKHPEGLLKNMQIRVGLNPPAFETPGYYMITWDDIAPNGGLTYVQTDTTTGKILYAHTVYNELLSHFEMEYATIHELSTGISAAGRSNALPSVWNLPSPSWEERNFTPTDLQMILYQYTRPLKNKIIDKDEGF
jgi:hypothetical protein